MKEDAAATLQGQNIRTEVFLVFRFSTLRTVKHLESNKLLSESQHGFRPRLSTATALTVVTDKIYKNMDNKRISLLTLCDLSKAFDSVSHQILIEKLKLADVDAFWFEDYLNERSQSVRLNTSLYSIWRASRLYFRTYII
ncbi:uncharacterized protein LOC123507276 [Portunus trituberculatus]|uniref:uncharacterized protein LOC123507276 n=1 Tax=Portunus trituberculatus TaxID=210409 RepID=UPI001E1CE53E|nr:uncharacterized protein LOC123507276 [Portunus trituberculatus]